MINLLHRLGFNYKKPKLILGKLDVEKQKEYVIKFRPIRPASPYLNGKVKRS